MIDLRLRGGAVYSEEVFQVQVQQTTQALHILHDPKVKRQNRMMTPLHHIENCSISRILPRTGNARTAQRSARYV
jgi:hypothetical protein